MFLATQELYLHIPLENYYFVAQDTFQLYLTTYTSAVQGAFFAFLCFQLVILVYLRGKLIAAMKQDMFQSRGILNLIPDAFFEENRDAVERLIQKLKD